MLPQFLAFNLPNVLRRAYEEWGLRLSLLSLCLKHAARCGIQELAVDHWPRAAPGILPKNYAHVRKANRSGSQQPVGTARASLLDREGDEGAHYVSPWLCSPVVIFKWNYSGMSGQFKFRTSQRFNFALAMLVWIFRMVFFDLWFADDILLFAKTLEETSPYSP